MQIECKTCEAHYFELAAIKAADLIIRYIVLPLFANGSSHTIITRSEFLIRYR